MRRPRGDEGTILVLTLGLTAVLLLLVGVVVDVSVVVLARRSVASAADGAALSAAQGLDQDVFYDRGPDGGVPLSSSAVDERVQAYAAEAALDQPGLVLTSDVEPPYVAVVTASRPVRLPLTGWLTDGTVTVTATARARAPLVP